MVFVCVCVCVQEVKNEVSQQLLAAAQTQLNQASRSLIISSKVFTHMHMWNDIETTNFPLGQAQYTIPIPHSPFSIPHSPDLPAVPPHGISPG